MGGYLTVVVYVVASYLILALNYRRLTDQNERRRVRALIPPTVIFWAIAVHVLIVQNWTNWAGTPAPVFFSQATFAIDGLLLLVFPLSLACLRVNRRPILSAEPVLRTGNAPPSPSEVCCGRPPG